MQRFGAKAVTIDIGCTLRASAVSSGEYVNDRDRAIMSETDGQALAAFRLHDLLDDQGSNLIYIPVSNAAYWTSYQHFKKYELESNHPLTEAGASVGYNVRDVGVVLVANNGETHNESPSDWTDAVASRCIRSRNESSDSDAFGGFVMFRYAPEYTPNTARTMQDKRIGALLTIRALVTDLERQTGHEPNAVLVKAAKNLRTQLELSALPETADLTKTRETLDAYIKQAVTGLRYDEAYATLVSARSIGLTAGARKGASDAMKRFADLGDFLNSKDLLASAQALSSEAQIAIDAQTRRNQERQRVIDGQRQAVAAQEHAAAQRASTASVLEERQAAKRLEYLASRYKRDQKRLILSYGRLPDAIDTVTEDGLKYERWTWIGRHFVFAPDGTLLH